MPSPFLIDAGGDVSNVTVELESAAAAAEPPGDDGMIGPADRPGRV